MLSSPHIRESDRRILHDCIQESRELSHQPGAAAKHFLTGLQNSIHAEAPASILFAGCMAPTGDMPFDYRGRLHHGPLCEAWINTFDWRLRRGFSPVLVGMKDRVKTVNSVGVVNVWTRPQLVDDSTWRRSVIFQHDILPLKITDQIFAWYQTPHFAVTYILRGTEGKRFDDHSLAIIKTAMGMLSQAPDLKNIICPDNVQPQLSPQLVRVRDMLICGLDREAIRKRLSTKSRPMSDNTVAGYIKTVFSKYRISGGRNSLTREFVRLGGSCDAVILKAFRSEATFDVSTDTGRSEND